MAAAGNTAAMRIAVVRSDRCKPKKCRQECAKSCPVVQMGKMCIEVTPASSTAAISEDLCVGCGMCVKRCPFEAVRIVNLPAGLSSETSHRYGKNGFQLHRLPSPRAGHVLGLIGVNGIGKSTALSVLGGRLKPNLGAVDAPPEWRAVIQHYRGSDLQSHFEAIACGNTRCAAKPQYVDQLPNHVSGTVMELVSKKNQRGDAAREAVMRDLQMTHLSDRDVAALSGGELQRLAIAVVILRQADVYMFDEPSSYLDVKQRMAAARAIRSVVHASDEDGANHRRVVCVEHDLALLDYMSDTVCCMYGEPAVYGVVTQPFGVREGINVFMAGYVPNENVRFRQEELSFKTPRAATELADCAADAPAAATTYTYPAMVKSMSSAKTRGAFTLHVQGGTFTQGEITVMLGQNGTGKSTLIKLLSGRLQSDNLAEGVHADQTVHGCTVSYKPQSIRPTYTGTVRSLLQTKLRGAQNSPQFLSDVMTPLSMSSILDRDVQTLSGGELQRVALTLCLGKPAQVYLIDEPSAFLDSEQRILAAKVIRRHVQHMHASAFVVEHDLIMATYLADRVVVHTGIPGRRASAFSPCSVQEGMHAFLKDMDITLRRDPTNHRPRINKPGSNKDREQKAAGEYFFTGA